MGGNLGGMVGFGKIFWRGFCVRFGVIGMNQSVHFRTVRKILGRGLEKNSG